MRWLFAFTGENEPAPSLVFFESVFLRTAMQSLLSHFPPYFSCEASPPSCQPQASQSSLIWPHLTHGLSQFPAFCSPTLSLPAPPRKVLSSICISFSRTHTIPQLSPCLCPTDSWSRTSNTGPCVSCPSDLPLLSHEASQGVC